MCSQIDTWIFNFISKILLHIKFNLYLINQLSFKIFKCQYTIKSLEICKIKSLEASFLKFTNLLYIELKVKKSIIFLEVWRANWTKLIIWTLRTKLKIKNEKQNTHMINEDLNYDTLKACCSHYIWNLHYNLEKKTRNRIKLLFLVLLLSMTSY